MAYASVPSNRQAGTEQGPGEVDENRRRLMSAFSIHHDGRSYRYNGYRYDRLAHAVAYAELMQSRQLVEIGPDPFTAGVTIAPPSASDSEVMAARHISFNAGTYTYREFHYDRLMDAVNYARMHDARTR